MKARVLVTGGAGFIGSNLLDELVPIADEVVVIDDLSTGSRGNIIADPKISFVEGSILDRRLLAEACRGVTAIVHLAAVPSVSRSIEDPLRSHHANATGTVHVLEAARELDAHVIVASSSSVYGANPTLPKHEDLATRPRSPYAASKLATEAYALAYAASFGIDVLALRFFNVYGPGQSAGHAYAAVIPAFVSAALSDREVLVHGDGSQTRDFTYVGTVAKALADAVTRRVTADRPINLAFGTRTSLLDLLDLLEVAVGHTIRRKHMEPRVGDVRDSQADSAAMQATFPDVRPVPLLEGLERTVEWFKGMIAAPQR